MISPDNVSRLSCDAFAVAEPPLSPPSPHADSPTPAASVAPRPRSRRREIGNESDMRTSIGLPPTDTWPTRVDVDFYRRVNGSVAPNASANKQARKKFREPFNRAFCNNEHHRRSTRSTSLSSPAQPPGESPCHQEQPSATSPKHAASPRKPPPGRSTTVHSSDLRPEPRS